MSDDLVALTYAELAERRGITLQSARRMVTRRRWAKTAGNDGMARVMVPIDALNPTGKIETAPTDDPPTVRELLAWATQRADAAEQRCELLRQNFSVELAAQRRLIGWLLLPWWARLLRRREIMQQLDQDLAKRSESL